jgi:hypothetical protein
MREVIAAAVSVLATSAQAQPPSDPGTGVATRAAILFEEGRALAKSGRWPDACDRFAQSYELVAAVGTQLNLADCLEHEGKLRNAWKLFEDAAQQAERAGTTSRIKFARDRAQAIADKLSVLVIKIEEPTAPGLAVTIDDVPVASAPIVRELVEPGAVVIGARMPGHAAFVRTVQLRAGKSTTVEVPALGSPMRRRRDYVYASGALGVLGVASLGGAVLSSYRANRAAERSLSTPSATVQREEQESAASNARLAMVFGISGLALVGISAIVYVVAPLERIKVTANATAGGGQITLMGSF